MINALTDIENGDKSKGFHKLFIELLGRSVVAVLLCVAVYYARKNLLGYILVFFAIPPIVRVFSTLYNIHNYFFHPKNQDEKFQEDEKTTTELEFKDEKEEVIAKQIGNIDRLLGKQKMKDKKPGYLNRIEVNVGPDISLFESALESDPENIDALIGLANAYALDKRVTDAMQIIDRILEIDPGNSAPRELLDSLRTIEKLQQVKKLTSDENESAKRLFDQAIEFFKKGDLLNAKHCFREVLEISPNNIDTEKELALVYAKIAASAFEESDNRTAISNLEQATELDPYNTNYWVLLASGYAGDGNISEAKKALRRALKFDPANSKAKQLLDALNSV